MEGKVIHTDSKILVISANMGNSNSNNIAVQNKNNVDFIYYNNTNFPLRTASFTSRMTAKIPKMLGWMLHPEYDYYIWIDATFKFSRSDVVSWFLSKIDGYDVALFKHPFRSSILSEANFIVNGLRMGDVNLKPRCEGEDLLGQVNTYLKDTNFKDDKLFAAGAFCYSSNLIKNKEYNMMKEWYFHTCFYGIRDQLSLPYILSKFNVKYNTIQENIFTCNYLR